MRNVKVLSALLGAIACVSLVSPVTACPMAYHSRLFPLGTSGDDIVAVELSVTRAADDLEAPLEWTGVASLVTLQNGSVTTTIHETQVSLADKDYENALRPVLAEFVKKAAEDAQFVELDGPNVTLCPFYSKECSGVKLLEQGSKGASLSCDSKRSGWIPFRVPVLEHLKSAADVEGDKALEIWLDERLGLTLISVREYVADKSRIMVVHIGQGTEASATHLRRTLAEGSCDAVVDCAYIEPTFHHGEAFDMVWVR